jgi:hypothetical protein
MAGARHPLIAADGANAPPDLGRERLEREPMIRSGEGARCGGGDFTGREQGVDGLVKAAVEDLL